MKFCDNDMAKKIRQTSEQSASDGESEEEREPKSVKSSRGRLRDDFILPPMDEKYTSCLEPGMDMELLEKGAIDSFQFQGTVAGQLTQPIYDLIKKDALTPDTLENNRKWKKESAEVEYSYLTRRYYAEDKKVVRDRRRSNKIVCEPACMFDLIMCSHVLNNHMTGYSVHRNLIQTYANVTRDFVMTAVRYCTKCKPNQDIKPFKKKRHKNVFWELLPLERVHVEIFQPFGGTKIANRFSSVLYCRDYYSRYVWLIPLKNNKRKHLITALSGFLFNLARIPMYLETTTIDRDDLFDMCGQIAEHHKIKVGLGIRNSQRFHKIGIRDMQQLLQDHREECLDDWNMCLFHGPFHVNQRANISSDGIPADLLYSSLPDCSKKFRKKRDEIISDLPATNVVQIGDGVLFLEIENAGEKLLEESDDFTDHVDGKQSQDGQNWTTKRRQKEEKKEGIKEGTTANRRRQDKIKVNNQGRNKASDSTPRGIKENETPTVRRDKNARQNRERDRSNHCAKEEKTIGRTAHKNIEIENAEIYQAQRNAIGTAVINDSDEITRKALEIKTTEPDGSQSKDCEDAIATDSSPKMPVSSASFYDGTERAPRPRRKKRKLLSKKLQTTTAAETSMEL